MAKGEEPVTHSTAALSGPLGCLLPKYTGGNYANSKALVSPVTVLSQLLQSVFLHSRLPEH